MKKLYLTILTFCLLVVQSATATSGIGLRFNRTGTDAGSVAITVVNENGTEIEGATATLQSSHTLKGDGGVVTSGIICPNVNGNTNPTITLTFSISGIPTGLTFKNINLDIHALNGSSNYQENNDGVTRRWNVAADINGTQLGTLADIDIAANVGTQGNVHKVWAIESANSINCSNTATLTLTITKGSDNAGCFFGLSEIFLGANATTPTPEPEPEPEPDPTPTPEESDGKVYYITWKNTGTNYITEESDNRMTVQSKNATKAQFWQFIPTGNNNCYYIKNTATGRYIGSCDLTPSSASKIYTTTTPTEYYVGKTSATSGEIAGCYYLSSTDCANYDKENNGPRALNKDGASDYVITWQAGTTRVGSYWTLTETPDLYEIRPFEASTAIGSIGASYSVESKEGKSLTITDGTVALAVPDAFDEFQEWYFVGTSNADGWIIASAAEPATTVGIVDGNIIAGEQLQTKWKLNASKEQKGYFYFTSGGSTLKVDGDSLFRFSRQRSAYARRLHIYNNPCGSTGDNYLKRINIQGEGATDNIVYESQTKPGTWHVVYAGDKGAVTKGGTFNVDATLASNASSATTVVAHFDWNCDGIFETACPLNINGTQCHAEVSVPEWAANVQTRMRLRVNSNGLDLAEDDVIGFIYDLHIKVVYPQEERTVTISVNSWERGTATLSQSADGYAYGTTLTATATPIGNARFICWREEGVVVSTEANYTFTVDRNVNLKAYFTPNTDESSYPTAVQEVAATEAVAVDINGSYITAIGDGIESMSLYTVDAALIAKVNGTSLYTGNVKEGLYILRINTAAGYKNLKIFIKK